MPYLAIAMTVAKSRLFPLMSWLEEYPLSFAAIVPQWDRQMSFIDPNAIFYVYACSVSKSILNFCVEM